MAIVFCAALCASRTHSFAKRIQSDGSRANAIGRVTSAPASTAVTTVDQAQRNVERTGAKLNVDIKRSLGGIARSIERHC